MKKFALTAIAGLALGLLIFAGQPATLADQQQAPPQAPSDQQAHGHGRGGMLKQLADALSLTDAQKVQIKSITKIAHSKIKTIRDDATMSKDAKRQQVKAINDQMWKDIEAILTPDQLAKLKDLRDKQKAERGHGKGGNKG